MPRLNMKIPKTHELKFHAPWLKLQEFLPILRYSPPPTWQTTLASPLRCVGLDMLGLSNSALVGIVGEVAGLLTSKRRKCMCIYVSVIQIILCIYLCIKNMKAKLKYIVSVIFFHIYIYVYLISFDPDCYMGPSFHICNHVAPHLAPHLARPHHFRNIHVHVLLGCALGFIHLRETSHYINC